MEINNSQNRRLKEIRKYLEMNQSDFSKSIDIDQAHLSQIENGKMSINSKILYILFKKYNVSIHWLFIGQGAMFVGDHDLKIQSFITKIENAFQEFKSQRVK